MSILQRRKTRRTVTGASTTWTFASSMRISRALRQSCLTCSSVMGSHRSSCSIWLQAQVRVSFAFFFVRHALTLTCPGRWAFLLQVCRFLFLMFCGEARSSAFTRHDTMSMCEAMKGPKSCLWHQGLTVTVREKIDRDRVGRRRRRRRRGRRRV